MYIGQTEWLLERCLKGHKFARNITTLEKHQKDTGHKFNFSEVKILKKENNLKENNLKESCVLESIAILKKHKYCKR